MNDFMTVMVFSLILIGFGYSFTIGAPPEGARVTMGALCIVSGVLMAVGILVFTVLSLFLMSWGAKW